MKQDIYNSDWINIDGNFIHKTAIIYPNVKLGTGNIIGPYCVIGGNGEIRNVKQSDFQGIVSIGDNNVISEHVTIQRPLEYMKKTIVCDNNIIMAHVHIGHDAYIGNNCEICTSSVIGGHVTVYDYAKIKLHSVVRNRLIIGKGALVGMGSVVTRDVPHDGIVWGNPAKSSVEQHSEFLLSKKIIPESIKMLVFWLFIVTGCLFGVLHLINFFA